MFKKICVCAAGVFLLIVSGVYAGAENPEKEKKERTAESVKEKPLSIKEMKAYVLNGNELDKVILEDKMLGRTWAVFGEENKHFVQRGYYEKPTVRKVNNKLRKFPGKQNLALKGAYEAFLVRTEDDEYFNPEDPEEIKYKEHKSYENTRLFIGFHVISKDKAERTIEQEFQRQKNSIERLKKNKHPIISDYRNAEREGIAFSELKLLHSGLGKLMRVERMFYFSDSLYCRLYVEYSYSKKDFYLNDNGWLQIQGFDRQKEAPVEASQEAMKVLDALTDVYFEKLKNEGIIVKESSEKK